MPSGPCPARPTSASHLQQQTREQLQLFPLQYPTLSLPARLETRAHEHDQEKQFSFGAAELSCARSSGLGWLSPAKAAARPSPPSSLFPLPPAPSRLVPIPTIASAAPSPPTKAAPDEGATASALSRDPAAVSHLSWHMPPTASTLKHNTLSETRWRQTLYGPGILAGPRLAMPEAAPQ